MSTLIIKLDEANTSRILDVLGDELVRGSIGAYHLLIEDGTPLDPTDGSPHLAPERDEAMLYAAAPELLEALQAAYETRYNMPDGKVSISFRAYRMMVRAIDKATKP
jgi:hypothetical protein